MAVIALALVGGAIGTAVGGTAAIAFGITAGAIGTAVGAAVGGYLDSQYIIPALFSKGDQSYVGPRIDDLSIQTASEGSPIKRVYGVKNKVAGTVIWISDLIEESTTQSSGGGKGGGGGGVSSTTFRYYVDVAIAVCEGEVYDIPAIYANGKKIYAGGVNDNRSTSITVYNGDQTQVPNALMETYEGSGNVPSYRGLCYVVIERFALADFGNQLPNITFEVEKESAEATVASTVQDIFDRAGFGSACDVSDITAENMRGYTLAGPTQTIAALEPIMAAFNLGAQLSNGVLRFFNRGDEDVVSITTNDMSAHEEAEQAGRRLTRTKTATADLPKSVVVKFVDLSNHLQAGAQHASKQFSAVDGEISYDFAISMSPTSARRLANSRLWSAWSEAEAAEFSLPPSYIHVQEGDLVTLTEDGETYSARVASIDRGSNYLHRVKAVIVDSDTADEESEGEDGVWVDPGLYTPPPITLAIMDGPALRETEILTVGWYWAMCATDPTDTYIGSSVLTSPDDVTYSTEGSLTVECQLGITTSTLLATSALADVWDYTNTVDIDLYQGTLSSVTEAEAIAGDNWAYVGDELIAFTTATALGGTAWRLSGLLRGLRDTFEHAATHTSTDRVAILAPNSAISYTAYGQTAVGVTRYEKGVAIGDDPTGIAGVAYVPTGGSARGFSPASFSGTRDLGTNDWTLSWFRRTRFFVHFPQIPPLPLEEPFERYEVDIYNGGSVVRTLTVNALTSVAYTSAMQVADFGSNQSTITARVYQITNLLGRGKAAAGTF